MIAVDSCYSGLEKRSFVIAFQEKVSDDIADILVTRYKLFTRVNFHHRCVRTAVDLKNAVYELSINYLQFSSKESKKIYCKNIQNLWNALSTKVQDKGLKIVRWNDSWLISCLQDALIGISDKK